MKKLLLLLMLGTALTAGACSADRVRILGIDLASAKRIKGSGKLATRTEPVPAFDAVHASRSVSVRLVAGGEGDRIVVEADDNLIDYVTVSSDGTTLDVGIDRRIQIMRAHITVTVPTDGTLSRLKATSSSDIVSEVPLTSDGEVTLEATSSASIVTAVNAADCSLIASSSADIRAGVRSARCSIDASSSADITAALVTEKCVVLGSSSADITLTGSADGCFAECNSSSDFNAGGFAVKVYDMRVSSSADAEIHCTERLAAHASSSGSIDYTGDCNVVRNVSSGGSVSKK